MDNVIVGSFGGSPFVDTGELANDVWAAIMEYQDRVSLMSVVGVLRLIEHKLLTEAHHGD